jgi:hypothetical protein
MSKKLNRAAQLIAGFNSGFDAMASVAMDRELRRVANEQPVVDTGFTDEQGQQLRAAAASGQYDIEFDPATKSYKTVAKADPNSVGVIAPTQRTTFAGKTVQGTMDDAQVSKARQLAMAGIAERHGMMGIAESYRAHANIAEERQFKRERERKASEREDWRFGQEQKKAGREDDFVTGQQALFDASFAGQRSKAFREAMDKYEADKKAGGNPAMPPPPTLTSGERAADMARALDYMASHKKVDKTDYDKLGAAMAGLRNEGYLRLLDVAESGAPLEQVLDAFNSQGELKVDASAIVSDKMVRRPDGVVARQITWRGPNGQTQTIDTATEKMLLGKSDELFKRAKQAHDMGIQERRAAVDEGNLAVNQTRAAQSALGGGGKPAAVQLAQAALDAGMFEDKKEALAWATRTKDASPEKVRADLYGKALTAHHGDAKAARKAVDDAMRYLFPDAAGTPMKPFTDADVAATAKKHGVSEDEVRKRLQSSGRSATQPAPVGRLPNEQAVRNAAALTPAEAARSAQFERSPGNLSELERAIVAERDPGRRAILEAEYRKQAQAAAAAQRGGQAVPAAAPQPQRQPTPTPAPAAPVDPTEAIGLKLDAARQAMRAATARLHAYGSIQKQRDPQGFQAAVAAQAKAQQDLTNAERAWQQVAAQFSRATR